MMTTNKIAHGLDRHISRKDEEAGGDQLLRPPLGALGRTPPAAKQPDDHRPGEGLDERVGAETDQSDRAGGDASADGDRELDNVPGIPTPRQQTSSPLEPSPLRH